MRESVSAMIMTTLISVAACAPLPPAEPIPPAVARRSVALSLPLIHPRIIVRKSKRQLELYSGDKLLRAYRVGLGFSPIGDKRAQGDGRTPEGEFYVYVKNPRSKFYLSLGLSYPGREDAERGLRESLITRSQHDSIVRALKQKRMPLQNTRLGGEIYIHGNGSGSDWTLGCVALDDADMKELYEAVEVGAAVLIEP
jgi:murein L,D-transpeptidase YafK